MQAVSRYAISPSAIGIGRLARIIEPQAGTVFGTVPGVDCQRSIAITQEHSSHGLGNDARTTGAVVAGAPPALAVQGASADRTIRTARCSSRIARTPGSVDASLFPTLAVQRAVFDSTVWT